MEICNSNITTHRVIVSLQPFDWMSCSLLFGREIKSFLTALSIEPKIPVCISKNSQFLKIFPELRGQLHELHSIF